MFQLIPTAIADAPAVEALLDAAFGPGRKSKTSYRYRDGVEAIPALSYVAREDDRIIGSISYWPIRVGSPGKPALLLGPLAVDPTRKNEGIGRALVFRTLEVAASMGHRLVLLVGDPTYYCRFGFAGAEALGIRMPDEDQARLQYRALDPAAAEEFEGVVRPWSDEQTLRQHIAVGGRR